MSNRQYRRGEVTEYIRSLPPPGSGTTLNKDPSRIRMFLNVYGIDIAMIGFVLLVWAVALGLVSCYTV